MMEQRGWDVLNGNIEGDENEDFTYVYSRGNSVIDYAVTNLETRNEIRSFKVGERINSDHLPLIIELYRSKNMEKKREGEKEEFGLRKGRPSMQKK